MTLEDRLRQMVTALPNEASIMLPVAQVAAKLGRSEGTVRAWIRSGKLEAYSLGKEYRITRSALAAFRLRPRSRKEPGEPHSSSGGTPADLGAWRSVRKASGQS